MWRRRFHFHRQSQRISKRIEAVLWLIILLVYSSTLIIYLQLKHLLFYTGAFDLGIFAQSLWTTANSKGLLFNTPEFEDLGVTTHFGVHFQPILLALVPLYKIIPRPEVLLLTMPLSLFLGGVILYKFGLRVTGDNFTSLILIALYVLAPFSWIVDDFHPVVFAIPIIFGIAYLVHSCSVEKSCSGNMILALVALIGLLLSVKEDAGIALVSLGTFYILLKYDLHEILEELRTGNPVGIISKNKLELILILSGVLHMFLTVFVFIPHFNGGNYPFLDTGSVAGSSYLTIGQHLGRKIFYFMVWGLYIGWLYTWRPKFLIPLLFPALEIFIMGSWGPVVSIGTHYSYILLSVSFIVIIYLLRDIRSMSNNKTYVALLRKALTMAFLLFLAFSPVTNLSGSSYVWASPIDEYLTIWEDWSPYLSILDRSLQKLGQTNCTLVVQGNLFPRLANRDNTYVAVTVYGNVYVEEDSIIIDSTFHQSKYVLYFIGHHSREDGNITIVDIRKITNECATTISRSSSNKEIINCTLTHILTMVGCGGNG